MTILQLINKYKNSQTKNKQFFLFKNLRTLFNPFTNKYLHRYNAKGRSREVGQQFHIFAKYFKCRKYTMVKILFLIEMWCKKERDTLCFSNKNVVLKIWLCGGFCVCDGTAFKIRMTNCILCFEFANFYIQCTKLIDFKYF